MAGSDLERSAAGTEADRRLARSVLLGLAAVALISLLAPLLTYLNEVHEAQRLLRNRVAREAAVYAEALALHFGMLEHELERIASRPQVDLLDQNLQPEQELLDFTHHNSPFFSGVVLLDSQGEPMWSEPRGVLPPHEGLAARDWFQRMLRQNAPVVDALQPGSRTFVVAAPVIRQGRISGAVVGLIDASKRGLPGGRVVTEASTLVVSEQSWFNGNQGLFGIPQPFTGSLNTSITGYDWFFVALTAVVAAIALFVTDRFTSSPWGRRLRAMRENADAAESLGTNVRAESLGVYVIGGAIAAVSGGLLVEFIGAWLSLIHI